MWKTGQRRVLRRVCTWQSQRGPPCFPWWAMAQQPSKTAKGFSDRAMICQLCWTFFAGSSKMRHGY